MFHEIIKSEMYIDTPIGLYKLYSQMKICRIHAGNDSISSLFLLHNNINRPTYTRIIIIKILFFSKIWFEEDLIKCSYIGLAIVEKSRFEMSPICVPFRESNQSRRRSFAAVNKQDDPYRTRNGKCVNDIARLPSFFIQRRRTPLNVFVGFLNRTPQW